MLHKALENHWLRIVIAVFASFCYAVGVNCFIVPMGLYSSGILGMCQVIRTLIVKTFALPAAMDFSGILYLIINIPILLLAWRSMGKGFLVRTLLCTVSSSLFLSLLPVPMTPILEERLASCLVGGIICGFSLGLTLTCGCNTGGLDVIGLMLARRGSGFTVGRFSLSFNVVLYAVCAMLFDLPTVIYSVIYMATVALFIDREHQQGISDQVMIFTKDRDAELPHKIMERLGRGLTYWEGNGAYTGSDIRVLCVCVSKFERAELEELVHETDPHAFFIVQEGVRIGGNFIRKIS